MVAAAVYVAPPAVAPARFGLLDAAIVIDDPTTHWQMGVEYTSEVCGTAHTVGLPCLDYPAADTVASNDSTLTATTTKAATLHPNCTANPGAQMAYESSLNPGTYVNLPCGADIPITYASGNQNNGPQWVKV